MKKFQFRLQVVLERAQLDEEAQQRAFALLQQQRSALLGEIARVSREREAQLRLSELRQSMPTDPRQLHQRFLYIETLANEIARLHGELDELDRRIETQRQRLVAAMQKRQLLESLHEKQLAAYLYAVARQEQQEMEETVLPHLFREQATAHLQQLEELNKGR